MKDMEDIKIAREETDLEWQPMLDGIHAYVDLRRLGRRLAVERLMTDETIAYLTGELERAIADVEKLTRERDEARAKVEDLRARAGRQLEIETRARDEARADAARLRRALEEATRALAVDPRYLSPARLGTARSILAAALAGEGEGASDA